MTKKHNVKVVIILWRHLPDYEENYKWNRTFIYYVDLLVHLQSRNSHDIFISFSIPDSQIPHILLKTFL